MPIQARTWRPLAASIFKLSPRSSTGGLCPFIAHLPFVAKSAELANDDVAERRQRLLTLLVRQPIPKLIENQRDWWARGGTMAVANWDMGLLLESRTGELASTATTQVSRKGRLWASSPNSVKAKQWGYSYSCLFGLLLTDFFTGSPFRVEVERDLSLQQQLLDVVIVPKSVPQPPHLVPLAERGTVSHVRIKTKLSGTRPTIS